MINILIVDDREDARSTLREAIEISVPGDFNFSVSDTFPFEDVDSYASYIREHDISALLLDERLTEESNADGRYSTYLGHQLVERLRGALPEFPVYVVTTHKTDDELVKQAGDVEDIVERRTFHREPLTYLNRIKRAAMRFQETMQRRLTDLNDLTLKAARGELTVAEQMRLNETRTALGLPFSGSSDMIVSDLIAEARALAAKSEELLNKIKGGSKK
jgi:DNA-binding NtrC family response regulator